MTPTLQRVLGVGLVVSLVAAIAGIVVLAALGKPQPVELLGLPAALIVAISTGQIFLGHQQVTTAAGATTAATIQGLTNALAGGIAGANVPATTAAPTDAPPTPSSSVQATPTMTTGSPSSGESSTAGGSSLPPASAG